MRKKEKKVTPARARLAVPAKKKTGLQPDVPERAAKLAALLAS